MSRSRLSMKNQEEGLNTVESITTVIVNLGTIVSWIFTLFTALTLFAQPQPVSIAGLAKLGKGYIIIFLISVLFGYIHLLDYFWRQSRLKNSGVEYSFASFLYGSIVKFRRPLVLVGFAAVFISIYYAEPIVFIVLTILIVIGLVAFVSTSLKGDSFTIFWQLDDNVYRQWMKRIKTQLNGSGYAFTSDFESLGSRDKINWAIEVYFNNHEFEQGLILSRHISRSIWGTLSTLEFLEIRFSHLPTRLKKVE